MFRVSNFSGLAAAFGLLSIMACLPAGAQSLGDIVDGLTSPDGPSVSIGDSDTGGSVSSTGFDGSSSSTSGTVTGGGNTAFGSLNLNNSSGTSADATLGFFSALLGGTAIDGSNANANIGLPGFGNLSLNQSGTTLGVSLGGDDGTTGGGGGSGGSGGGGNGGQFATVIASLSGDELMALKKRCSQILSRPSGFDRDLVMLCKAIRSTRR